VADKCAFVFMGHGTSHTAKATYTEMQKVFNGLGCTNVFVGTVEGEPEETEVHAILKAVQDAGFNKVILRPLMVVAGDHANNDMAGDEEDSWKSIFSTALGAENVTCQIAGLGEIGLVQKLYVSHVADKVYTSIANAKVAAISNKTYTGSAIKPTPKVTVDGKVLTAGTDYTLSYKNNVKVGTATITIKGKGYYYGTTTTTFKIVAKDLSKAVIQKVSNKTYTGSAIKPTPKVTVDGKVLTRGTDYTLSYKNNVKVGTATIIVTGKGNYKGTATQTFKIVAKALSAKSVTLSKTSYVYNGNAKKPAVTVKDGNKTLKNGTDYTVSYKNNKNVGKATVTIKGKGNYTGTVTKNFKIVPKGTTLTKVTKASKAFTAQWNAQKTQTTGYQIQYSTNKNFKSATTKPVKSNAKTSLKVSGLKANTTYYVRVRTYKTVGGVNYYSGWSGYKTVKTAK
ncbi:MAG: sirohydrochlorin cobaltochelatase, partial [Parasporobacterium sp.]|nr:sirohydrochlorin cobaltochelatase [Parasporobacterium sp.]